MNTLAESLQLAVITHNYVSADQVLAHASTLYRACTAERYHGPEPTD